MSQSSSTLRRRSVSRHRHADEGHESTNFTTSPPRRSPIVLPDDSATSPPDDAQRRDASPRSAPSPPSRLAGDQVVPSGVTKTRATAASSASSSSPLFVESGGTSSVSSVAHGKSQPKASSTSSSSNIFSFQSSSIPSDFERLSQEELFAMYRALDYDEDSVVSSADLFAFIALNPQSIDTVVGHHVGLVAGAEQYPYWAQVDSSKLGVVPIGRRGLAFECGPASWRPGLSSGPTASETSTNSGSLWWLRHRVATYFRDKKFVDFILNVAFSVLTKDQAGNSSAGNARSVPLGGGSSSFGGGGDASQQHKLNLTSSVFMTTTTMSSTGGGSARKRRSKNKCKGAHEQGENGAESEDAFTNRLLHTQIPQLLSFRSFCLLYYEVIEMLSAKEHAFMLVMLDVPMLLSVHTFFRFLALFCRLTGRMPAPATEVARNKERDDEESAERRLFPHFQQQRLQTKVGGDVGILSPSVLAERIPRCPPSSCASCISWLVGAWDQQRGMMHVPLLQRIGERFLFRKASAQDRQLKHFLRCFRHAWGPQGSARASASAMVPLSAHTSVVVASVAGGGKDAATVSTTSRKQVASSNLNALKVRGRLASMRVMIEQHSRGDDDDDDSSDDGSPTHRQADDEERSSQHHPPTTQGITGLTPPTRSLTPAAGVEDSNWMGNDGDMSPEYFAGAAGGESSKKTANGGKGGDSTSHVVHALAEPDPFSMISSLSCEERQKIRRIRFWCLLRACVYSLVTATIVGLTNLVCQVFFFSSTPSLFDTSISSSQALLNWISGGVYVPVQVLTTNASLNIFNSSNGGPYAPVTSTNSLGMRDVLKYQLVVSGVALALSVLEIVVLYLDNLQVCFSLAKTGGVPLHRYSNGSNTILGDHSSGRIGTGQFGSATDDRVLSVKDGLSTKRIRYFIAAISRCALQISFDTKTVLSIDICDSQIGMLSQLASQAAYRLQRIAPTLVVRVLVSRVLTKFVAPFIATPLMVMWNYFLAKRSVDAATSVVLGAITGERIARQLLDMYCAVPAAIVHHNSRAQLQQHTAAGSRDGGGVKISGIHQSHFHVYRELVSLIAFYMHMIGSKTVHPSLHIFLAFIASHLQLPEECLLCFGDSGTQFGGGKHDQSRRPSNIASTLVVEVRESSNSPPPSSSVSNSGRASLDRATDGHSSSICGGEECGSAHSTSDSGGHLSLVGVGGTSSTNLLPMWMGTMCKEMNIFRQDLLHSHSTDWAEEYVLNAASPSDAAARSDLCSRLAPSITNSREWRQCKLQHMLEGAFPGWACPATQMSAVNKSTLSSTTRVRRDGDADRSHRVDPQPSSPFQQQHDHQHPDYQMASRGQGAFPFSPRDVELFVTAGLLCCVLSNTQGFQFASCIKHTAFIRQLAISYAMHYAPHQLQTVGLSDQIGAQLVARVQLLSERYLEGLALDLGHVQAALRDTCATR